MASQYYFDVEDPPQSLSQSPRRRSNKKTLPDFDRNIPFDEDDPYSEPASAPFKRQRPRYESNLVLTIEQYPTCTAPLGPMTLIGNHQESGLEFLLAVAFFKELCCGHHQRGRYVPSEFSARNLPRIVNYILAEGITELAMREDKLEHLRKAHAVINGCIGKQRPNASKGDLGYSREDVFRQIAPGKWKDATIVLRTIDDDDIICSIPEYSHHQLTLDEHLAQFELFDLKDFVSENRSITRLRAGFHADGGRWTNYRYKARDHWAGVEDSYPRHLNALVAEENWNHDAVGQQSKKVCAGGKGKSKEIQGPETPRHRAIPAIGKLDLSSPNIPDQRPVASMSSFKGIRHTGRASPVYGALDLREPAVDLLDLSSGGYRVSANEDWTLQSSPRHRKTNYGASQPLQLSTRHSSEASKPVTAPPSPARQSASVNSGEHHRVIPGSFDVFEDEDEDEDENESEVATSVENTDESSSGGNAPVVAGPMVASSVLNEIQLTESADGIECDMSTESSPSPGPFGSSDDSLEMMG